VDDPEHEDASETAPSVPVAGPSRERDDSIPSSLKSQESGGLMFSDDGRSFETGIGSVSTLEPFRERLVQIPTAKGHDIVLFKGDGCSSDSISVEGNQVDSGETRGKDFPRNRTLFQKSCLKVLRRTLVWISKGF
jgi:hypothetical protein